MTRTILLVSLFSVSAHTSAITFTNHPGGPSWPSGVGSVSTGAEYTQWSTWLGYQPDIVTIFLPHGGQVPGCGSTWAQLAAEPTNGTCNYYLIGANGAMDSLPNTTPIVVSTPMVPVSHSNVNCARPATWDEYAAGDFDSYWTTWANNFKTLAQQNGRDPANHVIRLGWEMNGDWYYWSVCNKQVAFKTAWERTVAAIRAVIPGILFDFSVSLPYTGFTAGRAYSDAGCNLACQLPARDSYDTISPSLHDGLPEIINEQTWQEHLQPPTANKWIGLNEIVSTATAVNKKIGLTEYAINYVTCFAPWFQSPQPAFALTKYFEFLSDNASIIAWDTYFAPSCNALHFPERQGSPAAAKYKELWGSGTGGGTIDAGTAPRPPQLLRAN